MTPEELQQVFDRQDWSDHVTRYQMLSPEQVGLGTKIILLGKFLNTQKHFNALTFPTDSVEATQVVDLIALGFGYFPQKSIIYAFRNIEFDYSLGAETITVQEVPTIDFFTYAKGPRMFYHVLLYNNNGEHVFHHPRGGSLILANDENPEFESHYFDINKLKNPQPTLLESELNGVRVKEVDKMGLLKKLEMSIHEELQKHHGVLEDLFEETSIR